MNCSEEGAAATSDELLRQARRLLIEALNLMDRAEAAGHLGARLQHVIDDLVPDVRQRRSR
jgi:hypothetical protein